MDLAELNKGRKSKRRSPIDAGAYVYGKISPQSIDLEKAILGAIMVEKSAFDTAADILTAECFYVDAHQMVFRSMQSLARKNMNIDLLTVVEELKITEELEIVGGPFAISKLTNGVVSGAGVETHSRVVLQKFISREVIRISAEMLQDAYDDSIDVFDLLDSAEEKVLGIGTKHLQGDMTPISTVIDNAIAKVEEWRQNDGTLTGVTSGFSELDRATRGWQPGDLIILGARPSVGKTAFALNLVRSAAMNQGNKTTVAVWSLEMKSVYLALRMLAAESEIYLHRLQTGRLNDEQMQQLILTGANKLRQAKIFFDDNSNVNLRTLRSKARKLKKKDKLGLIVIDYLQLMEGEEGKNNREQEISKISRGLKKLAQELEVPIIALSQLTRDSDKAVGWGKSPAISSLRESGAIEQDADVVLLLWGPTEEEIKEDKSLDGKRKIKIAKQRNGMLITVELDFKNEIQLFQSIDQQFGGSFTPVKNSTFSTNTYEPSIGSRFTSDDPTDLPF